MKRYFDMPEKKKCLKVNASEGSLIATATVKQFEAQYKTPMREIDWMEYARLDREYRNEPKQPEGQVSIEDLL